MKKLIFLLFLFCFPSVSLAWNPYILGLLQTAGVDSTIALTGVSVSGTINSITATVNPCPTGTYLLAWNGDYTSDTDKGCFASGASTKDGTQTGGTLSASYGQVGVGYRKTAGNQYVSWAISSDDGFNDTVGTMWASAKVTSDGSRTDAIVLHSYISGCDIRLIVVADNRIEGYYTGSQTVYSTDTLTPGTWTRIAYAWDDTNNLHAVKIGAGAWAEASEALTSCSVQPTSFKIGTPITGTESDTIDIDNVYVLGTYQAADPYSP